MEEIFNEVKVNEYKIGSLWRSFYSSIVALLLSPPPLPRLKMNSLTLKYIFYISLAILIKLLII